ncbi:MAG: glycosyltransferase [Bacteroidetes bacterium]|nr:glycosyltransferase [Bacteroidota bacterium]
MDDSLRLKISIIIRTKNEEKWVGYCLDSIYSQKIDAEVEVIIVDNESTDHTIEVAKRYPVQKFININKFLPGKALNDGIRSSTGDYLVCISAHCVPGKDDWLEKLLSNFQDNLEIAGVYGRQLPLSFTDSIDKRDLLMVFGLDKRIQKKDYFFHNANSMIPRSVWEKFPFDENATNIEDRIWGKQVIEAGYKIIYEPEAAVYHHHGLHQGNTKERLQGVVSILEDVDANSLNGLPQSMKPDALNVAAVIPIIGNISKDTVQFQCFEKTVNDLKISRYIKSIYCVTEEQLLADSTGIKWLNRKLIKKADFVGLEELMKSTLEEIEAQSDFPDSILYVNHDYLNRPKGVFDELIKDAQYKGCDTVFPGLIDYGHYWYQNADDVYMQTDSSLESRKKRDPLYKALYGLGCLTASWAIRTGLMVSGKVGILKITNPKYALRIPKI